jgi:hypothetical protein
MLSRLRTLVKEADPEVVEEWKWRGVPVGSHDGMMFTDETYKNVVKMTFAKGAALKDPSGAEPRSEHRAERPRRRLAVLRAGRQNSAFDPHTFNPGDACRGGSNPDRQ